jgi:hypothetical protein
MAENKVKITFEVDGIQKTVGSVEELENALKGVQKQAAKTEGSVNSVADAAKDASKSAEDTGKATEGALKVIDEATGGLGTKVKEVGGGLKAMGKQAITAFKGAVQGASAMGKALIATGIGALVVAVGLLVAYWDDIKGFVSGVSSEQKKLLADTEATRDAAQQQLEATEGSEASLKLAGKSEQEIRDLKIQQTNEVITATEAILEQQKQQKKAQIEAAERNQKITAGIIGFLTAPITILLGAVDALTLGLSKVGVLEKATSLAKDFTMGTAALIFNPEDVAEEGDATIAETEKQLRALKNKRDGFIVANRDADKKASDDAAAKAKENAEKRAQTEAELNAELARLRAENIKDEEAKALALLELDRQTKRKELEEKGASDALLLELDKNYELQAQAIRDQAAAERQAKEDEAEKVRKEKRAEIDAMLQEAYLASVENQFARAQEELALEQQTALEKLRINGATEAEIAKVEKMFSDRSKKLAKEETDYKKELGQQELNAKLDVANAAFAAITEIAGEQSVAGKAAAVASATINTYQAATNALANTPAPPPFPQIAAGLTIVSGLLNVKKILSTKVPGGGGGAGGGSVSSAGSIPSPTTSSVFSAVNQAAGGSTQMATAGATMQNASASNQPAPVKAFVIAQEVSSAQEANKKIENLSTL